MLADVVGLLACPHCGGPLVLDGRTVRCGGGHAFDVARQGYVNLLRGDARTGTADTAAMVAARQAFFDAGHFAPLSATVAAAAVALAPPAGCVLDLGAGTGHHLAAVLDALPDRAGLALDLSKHAARRAARAHPRIGAVVTDAWSRLPVRDGVAALVLSVFAPRDGAEMARVLAPGGAAIVVTPTPDHLRDLVDALDLLTVDEHKPQRLARTLEGHLVPEGADIHRHPLALDHDAVAALVAMGPSAHHVDADRLRGRIAALPQPVRTAAEVRVARYRRAPDADAGTCAVGQLDDGPGSPTHTVLALQNSRMPRWDSSRP
ncbi:MAG TPA: methyltransferase domain-containing protein [Euzebyales bacterium]|nr:methyltransferase domain-containing protein [Euzebyales bacterium]